MCIETLSNKDVWKKIEGCALADLEEGSFLAKLNLEHQWTNGFTERAINEYKRFIYLAVIAKHPVSPSRIVDQVWHVHLSYTNHYWNEFCPNILNKNIHHRPSNGSKEAQANDRSSFTQTLELYRTEFATEPPRLIWSHALHTVREIISNGLWLIVLLILALSYTKTISLAWLAGSLFAVFGLTALLGISNVGGEGCSSCSD